MSAEERREALLLVGSLLGYPLIIGDREKVVELYGDEIHLGYPQINSIDSITVSDLEVDYQFMDDVIYLLDYKPGQVSRLHNQGLYRFKARDRAIVKFNSGYAPEDDTNADLDYILGEIMNLYDQNGLQTYKIDGITETKFDNADSTSINTLLNFFRGV